VGSDELLEQRLRRAGHHVLAIQRLISAGVIGLVCVDEAGRPSLMVSPDTDLRELRDLLFMLATKELSEA
jgi:hypothetical protein